MRRTEIKGLRIVGRHDFPSLGSAICNQLPHPDIGFWLKAGGLSTLLPLAGGGWRSKPCPLSFFSSEEVKTSALQSPRLKNIPCGYVSSPAMCGPPSTSCMLPGLWAPIMLPSPCVGPTSFSCPHAGNSVFSHFLVLQTKQALNPSSSWQGPRQKHWVSQSLELVFPCLVPSYCL